MGKYKMDMSQEKTPNTNVVLDEGWYPWEIVKVTPAISKKNNEMFEISLALTNNPNVELKVYPIATKGKRWFLKELLTACDVPAGQDGVYEWDEQDIEGKTVEGLVSNVTEEWIDREGKNRTTIKSKVVQFRKLSSI